MLHGEFTDATNAQSASSNLGKLLRLRPRRDQPGFDPAPGNAFPDDPARSPLVYAMGFRSPWWAYRDSKGRYLVGDVGNTNNEELNLVTQAGQNFGWNGSRSGPCNGAACAGLTNPLSTYRNNNDPYEGDDPGAATFEARAGRAVWVGVQYQDCGMDRYKGAMTGVYLFGDWYTGWVRGAVIGDDNKLSADRTLGVMPGLSAWDQGPDGYLYALRFGAYGTGGHANEGSASSAWSWPPPEHSSGGPRRHAGAPAAPPVYERGLLLGGRGSRRAAASARSSPGWRPAPPSTLRRRRCRSWRPPGPSCAPRP